MLLGVKTYPYPRKATEIRGKFNYEYELSLSKVFASYKNHRFYSFLYSDSSDAILDHKLDSQYSYLQKFSEKFKLSASSTRKISSSQSNLTNMKATTSNSNQEEFVAQKGIKTRRKYKESANEFKWLHSQCISNQILLFDKEKLENSTLKSKSRISKECLKEYRLVLKDGTPLLPFQSSQYVVDYANSRLFYFNIMHQGKLTHFEFSINSSSSTLEGTTTGISNVPWEGELTNMGLCVGKNKMFVVYGRLSDSGAVCNSGCIYVYDLVRKAWLIPKVKGNQLTSIIKRHSVTCCVFQDQKTEVDYLYVFGGERDAVPEKELMNINNIVEFYKINWSKEKFEMELEHTLINKRDLYHDKVSYVPYIYSYAFQLNRTNNIFVLGGKRHSHSPYESKTIHYFNYR